MERLTSYDGNYYYPHCMKGSTCDGHGSSEKCNECEFNERVCVTLGKYEDTGLTPEQIMELKERDESKPPIYQVQGDERYEQEPEWWMCPSCEEVYDMDDDYDFCPNCGQRILR